MHQRSEILLCFAVKEECRFFAAPDHIPSTVNVLITGMGRKNAERSFRTVLAKAKPDLVLTSGFAGGLRPGLERGAVLFAGAKEKRVESALLRAGARPGLFHPSDRVVTGPQEKRKLHESTGADAVEMESFAISAVCREHGIPGVTLRVILDTAEEELPLDFNQVLTSDQRLDGRKLAAVLLRSPGKIPGLLQLRKQSEFAAKELGRVLRTVLEQLCTPG